MNAKLQANIRAIDKLIAAQAARADQPQTAPAAQTQPLQHNA